MEQETPKLPFTAKAFLPPQRGHSSEGAAAPISTLSRLALKDAVLELESTVRNAHDVSSAAMLQLWQSAERHLGVEVHIDDPALRGLFGLQVVAVEELCSRVRAHAEATLVAVQLWSQPKLQVVSKGLVMLSDHSDSKRRPTSPSPASAENGTFEESDLGGLASDLLDVDGLMEEARQRVVERIQREVCGRIDERLQAHAEVREIVRERQRWHATAAAARRDVARLRKGAAGESGLTSLNGHSAAGPLQQAEAKLEEAVKHVAEFDEQLLLRLADLQEGSVDSVRRPWAALAQIQAEYFTAQQAMWTPLAPALRAFAAASVTAST